MHNNISRIIYDASSSNVQQLVVDFFNSMDTNIDGKVDFAEFIAFMKQEGYPQLCNRYFFDKLDREHNGNLGFSGVTTLYVLKSGRPFCDSCGHFIPGMFFSSTRRPAAYYLCPKCFEYGKGSHRHRSGKHFLLDNYMHAVGSHQA